jgi:hypothetical protein
VARYGREVQEVIKQQTLKLSPVVLSAAAHFLTSQADDIFQDPVHHWMAGFLFAYIPPCLDRQKMRSGRITPLADLHRDAATRGTNQSSDL